MLHGPFHSFCRVSFFARGLKFGITPEPQTSFDLTYRYKKTGTELVNYYDTVDLPKKAFNCLHFYMMFMASIGPVRASRLASPPSCAGPVLSTEAATSAPVAADSASMKALPASPAASPRVTPR